MNKRNLRLRTIAACIVLGLSITGCGENEVKTEQSTAAVTEAVTESESATEETISIDKLTEFELTSTSIENGEWKQSTGGKLDNRSPELSWDAVDGASKYAVIMIDKDAMNWLHWYVYVDKTHLKEGEYTEKGTGYIGPYPPATHEYNIYVIALTGEPKKADYKLDTTGEDINSKLEDLDIATDGSSGNVLAYGVVGASFTPAE